MLQLNCLSATHHYSSAENVVKLELYLLWKVPPQPFMWCGQYHSKSQQHDKVHSHTSVLVFGGLYSSTSTRLIQCTLLKNDVLSILSSKRAGQCEMCTLNCIPKLMQTLVGIFHEGRVQCVQCVYRWQYQMLLVLQQFPHLCVSPCVHVIIVYYHIP